MNKQYYLNLLINKKIMSQNNFQYLQLCSFSKDECILYQGQDLENMYILVSGKTKTCKTTANGTTILAAVSYPITVIGEVEFLNNCEVVNSVYALHDSICFKISVNLYRNVLLNDLLFMRYLASMLAYRLYNANHNMSISINYPVENRLASYLLAKADNLIVEDNFVEVAKMIGCSYRQLQRIVKQFDQLGYVDKLKRGVFKITNLNELEKLGKDVYHI